MGDHGFIFTDSIEAGDRDALYFLGEGKRFLNFLGTAFG
jgi:hypothetical protein